MTGTVAGGPAEPSIHALGPLEARRGGEVVALGGRRQRVVLAALLLQRSRPVSADHLVELVWGAEVPPSAVGTLQAYLSRLRRALGDAVLARDGGGYRVHLGDGQLDIPRFELLVVEAEAATDAGDHAAAAHSYGRALALWRGDRFLGELGSEPFARAEATRLEQLRLHALRSRIDAELQLGHHDAVAAELDALVRTYPYDEHLLEQFMLATYRSGRPVAALQAYRTGARLLREEVGVEPGSRLRALEQRILQQDPSLSARMVEGARRAAATNPTNLRAVSTGFVGRQEEVRHLVGLLERSRLVTVVGPGGVGKTRLAIEACWELVASSPGGVWDVDLAPLTHPEHVARPLADALGLAHQAGPAGIQRIVQRLRGQRTVVLLDNCEHLLEPVRELVATLRDGCPELHVVTTTRELLGDEGDAILELQPLALPPAGPAEPAEVDETPSVRLFTDRAAAVVQGFRITAVNRAEIVATVRRLDGVPLAIELAAATLDVLTPRQLAERVTSGFPDLTALDPVDARHATLRATMDWSYDLLPSPAQHLLDRLAIFAGPWSEEAVTSVCAGPPLADDELTTSLAELVRRSLVAPADAGSDGTPRYRLLELVREYGLAHLTARGDLESARTRHLGYVTALVERAAEHLHDSEQARWFARLRDADAEIERALRTLERRGDIAALRRLVDGLWLWWYLDQRHDEATSWLARATEGRAPPAGLVAASALVLAERVETDGTRGVLALVDRALAAPTEGAAEAAMVSLLVGDALTAIPEGLEAAERHLTDAFSYFRAHGPAWAAGWATIRQVRVDGFLRADLRAASQRLARAMETLRAAGDLHLLAYGQLIVANMARLHGSLPAGLEAITEALVLYGELGIRSPFHECQHIEGSLLTELGRLDDAAHAWRGLRDDAARTGASGARFGAELGLAEVHARAGRYHEAGAILEAEYAARTDPDDVTTTGPILVLLAPVAAMLARTEDATARTRRLRDQAMATWGGSPVPWYQLRALLAAGEASLYVGDDRQATDLLEEAARRASDLEQPHRAAAAAEGLAVLAGKGGAHEEVVELLGAAYQLRDDTGAAAWSNVVERNTRLLRGARQQLGADAFTGAWGRGAVRGIAVLGG
jgi:predicted ATPase/DNA-binding SARP family transcriptional activator/tetratricopeptide (TPR) repeat protein